MRRSAVSAVGVRNVAMRALMVSISLTCQSATETAPTSSSTIMAKPAYSRCEIFKLRKSRRTVYPLR